MYTTTQIASPTAPVTQTRTDYVNGFVYVNNELDFFANETGRVLKVSGGFERQYVISDHLGNARISVKPNANNQPVVLQYDSYYPFGLEMGGMSFVSSSENKYKYNGKEKQTAHNLGWYDYGARFYDPQVGRWFAVDALADEPEQIDKSVYAYAWNNPTNLTDPDGNCPQCIGFAVGFITEIAVQKLTGQEINYGKALISGGAGALSGGLSTLKNVGTVGKVLLTASIDASESLTKQAVDGKISTTQIASDVITSGFAGQAKVVNNASIKVKENTLNRTTRIATNDPSSSGRAANASKAKSDLKAANTKNQVVGSVSGDAAQTASDIVRPKFSQTSGIKYTQLITPQDNTIVVKKNVLL